MNVVQSKEDARYVNDLLDKGISLEQAHAQLEVMKEEYDLMTKYPAVCGDCGYELSWCHCPKGGYDPEYD